MNMEERVKILKDKIKEACEKSHRNADEIAIVAVTKTISPDKIEKAYSLGFRLFGENRVQEARDKIPQLEHLEDAIWHLIGHLQTNKVKYAVKLFSMIQSVDSVKLLEEINKRAEKRIPVLIEVNTSGEPQKHGVNPWDVSRIVEFALSLENIEVMGFMTVGPYPVDELKSRRAFSLLREIREKIESEFERRFPILSMGMTEDFEYAILEGSNMLRIGRGIFGERE